jgi:hypothetical protein
MKVRRKDRSTRACHCGCFMGEEVHEITASKYTTMPIYFWRQEQTSLLASHRLCKPDFSRAACAPHRGNAPAEDS